MTANDNSFDLVIWARRAIIDGAERAATVAVADGRIVQIGGETEDWSGTEELELADDEVLLPGLVDSHVHVNEPGRTEWEGFETATRAALRGGITTIIDMPLNSLPPTTDVEALGIKKKSATGECFVDVGFWGGAVPGNINELAGLHAEGVFGFKCFLIDSGVEEFPPLSTTELGQYMAVLADLDALMIVHAEDADAMADAPVPSGRQYQGYLASRPHQGEDVAIAHVIEAARATGCRAHILHLSSADALAEIAEARSGGVRLTVETCPHYLSFAAETIREGQTPFKCCPPIREEGNRQQLWQALDDGLIDCIVSDHSPCVPELKQLESGDFGTAWGGVASLQVGLPAIWTEAARRGHGLADVVRWMAAGPARLVGLERKGAIQVGHDADFAVFAPDDHFVVDAATLEHRNPVSPYSGLDLAGVVRSTWLRGTKINTQTPQGKFLIRGQS